MSTYILSEASTANFDSTAEFRCLIENMNIKLNIMGGYQVKK
jgi:hypothetical protein